jgi:excisionase family DNA binding protein
MEMGMENLLSVSQVASLCGVGHSTVGCWIRANRLRASRVGNQYSIPVEELILYLKSKGQKIPDELVQMNAQLTEDVAFTNCWQYFKGNADRHECNQCLVFMKKLKPCFAIKKKSAFECSTACLDCGYYMKTYFPRIKFIHQISYPAAILKDFYLWGGNKLWVELCGIGGRDLPGMGIEQIFHPDLLEKIIASMKKKTLKDPSVTKSYNTFFNNDEKGKIAVQLSVYGLNDPADALLILAGPK